jgi:hypothetical protein
MSHPHEHLHDRSSYYLEQLCTIAVCASLGGVAVMLFYQEILRFILANFLHKYVLWSGLGLLTLAAIRGAFLWFSVKTDRHKHCHQNSNGCDHEHGDGWKPGRYVVLCLPVMLYLLNLPNQGFSAPKAVSVEELDHPVLDKSGRVMSLGFTEMERWAYNEFQRESYEGRTGRIKGQFYPETSHRFRLFRGKIKCCYADIIWLNVFIICKQDVGEIAEGKWVEVTGQVQFRKKRGREEYVPVLEVKSRSDIRTEGVEEEPYLQ